MAPGLKTVRIGRYAASGQSSTPRTVAPLKAHRIKDIATKLQQRKAELKLTPTQSQAVVKDVLNIVQDILMSGDDVMLQGFGKFSCRESGQRSFRNPRTGETIVKDSYRRVSFQPSAALKRTLSEAAERTEEGTGNE